MRTGQRTTLVPIGSRLVAGSLFCFLLVAGCNPPRGDDPNDPAAPTPNQQPQAVGSIQAQEVEEGAQASVNVANNFNDPDGDQLTYSATSSSASRA